MLKNWFGNTNGAPFGDGLARAFRRQGQGEPFTALCQLHRALHGVALVATVHGNATVGAHEPAKRGAFHS